MSSSIKRTLNDLTNENKRLKNDSAIDLTFDTNKNSQSLHSTSKSLINDDSMFDDDVFDEEPSGMISLLKNSQNQGRKRLNGTSTYQHKRKSKSIKKENIITDQTLNQLREEQARIDAHSLSTNVK